MFSVFFKARLQHFFWIFATTNGNFKKLLFLGIHMLAKTVVKKKTH